MKVSNFLIKKIWKFTDIFRTLKLLQSLSVIKKTIIDLLLNLNYTDNLRFYRHPVEKIVYLIVHIVTIIGMSFIIFDMTLEFQNSPTVTTVETDKYPIQEINYPAISICNINKISLLSAIDLAEELWLNLKPRNEKLMVTFHNTKIPIESCCITCDCLPSCEDITYTVSTSDVPLNIPHLTWNRKRTYINNHSLVHIYFGSFRTTGIKQDMLFYWYELMSNYGGICSLFLGLSIISLIEMLYFCIARCINSVSEPSSVESTNSGNNVTIKTINVEPKESQAVALYWKEISGTISKEINLKFSVPRWINEFNR